MAGSPAVSALASNGPATSQLGQSPRARENFNAGWRFHLGDAAGAQSPGYDDGHWQSVGLPHSFSIPYFQSASFYVGYGWYRKTLTLDRIPAQRQFSLEFEAAFQDAEIYVNGIALARHRGGYTGFSVNLTPALHAGANSIAVRVNNQWEPTLAPRAGEHVFSGGIYRDVWLVQTDSVHVPWMGTYLTTPGLTAEKGRVALETEVRNDGPHAQLVEVLTDLYDDKGRKIASLPPTRLRVHAGDTATVRQLSGWIRHPVLWSPETPRLYLARTRLRTAGQVRDAYSTEFGFRWFTWTADKGFFLNGRHRYFRGANVHQDQAGWGDAVSNRAIERDVDQIKEAGFDFIRGSHYPHDPHFSTTTDRRGVLLLSEAPFWGTAGFNSPWGAPAYPPDPAHRDAFDASVKQQLGEMIRIHRNHPSIIAWSMGNEAFFTSQETMPQVRRLLKEMVDLSHQLDPSRPAAVSGVQRGNLDHLGDIAGYNGDGAILYPNPGIPSFVAEYGSTIADRPGAYAPGWGDLEQTPGAQPGQPETWRQPWRSGEAIWAGFDHGSIAGRQFGSMGLVDYARLPKRAWYWYRNAYRGIAPPDWPKPGIAAALRLSASAQAIERADGTDDVQLVLTVVDNHGNALSNSPPVRLAIESGPGELPTGRQIDFAPGADISIRDGQAAIAMRSWQAGVTRLRATSPGLRDATLEIHTLSGPKFVPGVTPLSADRPYRPSAPEPLPFDQEQIFGGNNPTSASSSAPAHQSLMANDGDADSYWAPAQEDPAPWLLVDLERIVTVHRLVLGLRSPGQYAVRAEIAGADGTWAILTDLPMADYASKDVELPTEAATGRKVRLSLRSARPANVGVTELRVAGKLNN
ncbi:glycoside hydrolase family 2 protein [Massilia eburnea]|uniref:glycoside hydrolase family 2 protein n=1 Tax=Massilia eburnea TaxID=1776165 RepID=UPI001BA6C97C|nr:glycoside hydrolase family 2 TIM barrel-domain containing protein [Massilia eburnea]